MTGLSGLIDSLLTAKISPRLDVLAIKGETEINAPGPVSQVQKVVNDVRLPSNAALDRLIPVGPSDAPVPAGARQPSEADLSVAARVISAVLANLHGDAGPVRGTAPAWPSAQTASTVVLAGALAQTVSDSGLFYESHLVEFASGTRSLAQMAQEPQARWASPAAAQSSAALVASVDAPAQVASKDASPAMVAQGAAVLAAEGQPADVPTATTPPFPVRGTQSAPDAGVPMPAASVAHPAESDPAPDAARVQAAYRRGEAPSTAAHLLAHRVEEVTAVRHAAAAAVTAGVTPEQPTEVIHPQAMTLVHQQLDLLATAVFRWSGQAWPGVPMDWAIHEEIEEREARPSEEESPRRWSTTVSLSLPRLGAVDLRLTLAGSDVQARLEASDATTLTRMRADGGVLAQRLEAAGFRLQELQVTAIGRP
ncbi:flagellar hook-length control protein FliK [Variovorax sp. GT1P44]|uniref:flagellar hook-length control protein FliK n=1 Tax=Variovorax sp. GT1P44 TaxID=3443742 RepID=UPI003F4544BE